MGGTGFVPCSAAAVAGAVEEARGLGGLFVLGVFQRAAWSVVGFECCVVEVFGCGLKHWFAAFWAWCAVFVSGEEYSALFLVLCAVAALCRCLGCFGFFVVPGGCDFEHVFGALLFAAFHHGVFAWVDGDYFCAGFLVFG